MERERNASAKHLWLGSCASLVKQVTLALHVLIFDIINM